MDLSIFNPSGHIDKWIEEKDLWKKKLKEYKNPQRITVRVTSSSDRKGVERKMDKYQHKENKKDTFYVMIESGSGSLSTHTIRRTTTTTEGDREIPFFGMNFGTINIQNNISFHNEGGDADTRCGSGSHGGGKKEEHRHRGDGKKREHRHHRRRRSGDSQDNKDASRDRRERHRDRSRDTLREKESENGRSENRRKGPELDSREKSHGRTKHKEDNLESEDSGTEISRPPGRASTVIQSSAKGHRSRDDSRRGIPSEDLPEIDAISLASSQKPLTEKTSSVKSSIKKHRSRDGSKQGIPLEDLPKTNTSSLVSSHRASTGKKPSIKDSKQNTTLEHIPEIDAHSIAPSQISYTEKTSSIRGPIPEHRSIDGSGQGTLLDDLPGTVASSLASSQRTFTGSSHSSRAPSTTAQSRSSKKNDTLPPSLYKLTKENKGLLDANASQDDPNSTSSQHTKPKSQDVFQENRNRRRSERKNGLPHTV
ncbi:hypothetical protein BPAE_0152g00010 [Botrytis paeoniae]|uniref:Uncharacterized protein n=1 Tax=Botrytis paeoniae TaxID=278948 RepID=A0A4Z1FE21_9HELO|nr:hypothetical protein BPAE_0152g00010 [Botrytis paeoniae]